MPDIAARDFLRGVGSSDACFNWNHSACGKFPQNGPGDRAGLVSAGPVLPHSDGGRIITRGVGILPTSCRNLRIGCTEPALDLLPGRPDMESAWAGCPCLNNFQGSRSSRLPSSDCIDP